VDLLSLKTHKHQQHGGRNEHIQPEERADAVGEELTHEQTDVHPVFQNPRHELRVRDRRAEDAKNQINIFAIHSGPSRCTFLKAIPENL
jgi:myo-inositol-1-phosphate synthase